MQQDCAKHSLSGLLALCCCCLSFFEGLFLLLVLWHPFIIVLHLFVVVLNLSVAAMSLFGVVMCLLEVVFLIFFHPPWNLCPCFAPL